MGGETQTGNKVETKQKAQTIDGRQMLRKEADRKDRCRLGGKNRGRKQALNEARVQSRGRAHFKSVGEKLQAANELLLLVQTLQGMHTLQTHWTLLQENRKQKYSNMLFCILRTYSGKLVLKGCFSFYT